MMDSETRQKRIEELKALRAELMDYKESSEGEAGAGSSDSNASMNSSRKDYTRAFEQEMENTQSNRGELKIDMYMKKRQ